MNIYAISGLGANEHVFQNLEFPAHYKLICLSWILPLKEEPIDSYALRMGETIIDRDDFILMGLSFGGIIAQEIAKHKKPKMLILFSTVKSEQEKPWWIRLNKYLKLYRIFPYFILNHSPVLAIFSAIVHFLDPTKPNISELYSFRNTRYTRWAFEQIVFWDNKNVFECNVYHFHGSRDFIFPIRNIKQPIKVQGSGHLAVYEQGHQISQLLQNLLF